MSKTIPSSIELFQTAIAAYEQGALQDAITLTEQILVHDPAFADAHNLLSAIAQDQGRLADAEKYARQALAEDKNNPIYLNSLGNTLRRLGLTNDAIVAFEAARRQMPDQPDILFNLANALRDSGRFSEAGDVYRASLVAQPGNIPVYNNLAITLKAMGDPEGAATTLIEALAFAPKSPELRFNLGNALQAAGRMNAAESAYRRAVDLRPDHADAWVNLGVVVAAQGRKAEAEVCFKKAIQISPDLAQAYVGLADLADDGSLDAVAHRRNVLDMRPNLAAIHSSLLMCLHYTADASPEDIADEHLAYGERHQVVSPPAFSDNHNFSSERQLRLGVVSGDFRFHAMRFFALPVFAARDRGGWSLTCYSTTVNPDPHTKSFHRVADHWRDVRAVSDTALVDLIVSDEIDILIDLSGHAPHNRLKIFNQKPAPLQVAWGDYVNTRGLSAIDILIGDAVHTPMAEQDRYVERLVHMPTDYICYEPPPYLPPASQSPAEHNGFTTFGTFSELTKIQPETIALWAAVLRANPDSQFFANGYLLADEARQGRLFSAFMDNGIPPDRIRIGTGGEHANFLEQYDQVDVIMDTWPYSGGLTTCEALVMGVPVVTLTGDRFSGRHATAHLRAAGFSEWAAKDEATFIEITSKLCRDGISSARRREIRKQSLTSPLCDVAGFSAAFFERLGEEWQHLCAGR